MNIPQGFIELGMVGVVGFVFKVVFGLITKNEAKSDEADQRLEGEIKALHREMKEMEQRFRTNDHKIFDAIKDIAVQSAKGDAQLECLKNRNA